MGKWDKIVSLVIKKLAGRFLVRISAGSNYCFLLHNVQTNSGFLPVSYSTDNEDFSPGGKSAQKVKFITHFHFLLTLKVNTHLLLLPLHVFISWTGTTLISFQFPLNHSSQHSRPTIPGRTFLFLGSY
jgi:hypothetical protein